MTHPPFPRKAHSESCPERPNRLTVDGGGPKQGSKERCVNCGDMLGSNWNYCESCARSIHKQNLTLRGEVEALRAAVRDGVVLLQAAHRYVLDADAQFFAFEIEQYIRAQKEHDHE